MGCCGCTNRTSVVTAGILGLLQSTMGLTFNIYFLALYFGYEGILSHSTFRSDQEVLLVVTSNQFPLIHGLLITATVLHIAWLMSSIVVLVGNSRDDVRSLRQWIVFTILIIVGDVLLPILLLAFTFLKVKEVHDTLLGIDERYFEETVNYSKVLAAMWKYYIILVFSFGKFGLISLITNICLCAYTKRRIDDLSQSNPQHGPTSGPMPYGHGGVQVFPLQQQYGFPTPQQQGYPMPQSFHPVRPQPTDTISNDGKY